jgi:hypothetical protein
MKGLLIEFKSNFFAEPICFLTAIIGLVIVSNLKTNRNSFIEFRYYFAAYIILTLISYTDTILKYNRNNLSIYSDQIQRLADFIFTIIEYFVFALFLKSFLPKKIFLLSTISFSTVALSVFIYCFTNYSGISNHHNLQLFTLQAMFLIVLCVSYFIRIFKTLAIPSLRLEPSFWITTGLTFFMISTLPYSMFSNILLESNQSLFFKLFNIYYVFYVLLFIMIIKGCVCKQEVSK